jgi:dihydroorotate dehydrogenase (NAD+) catalytic subunit
MGFSLASDHSAMDRYDISHSYEWNYENAPQEAPSLDVPQVDGDWDFCGIPVPSPLGMPAGPLLNSSWIVYYSRLGFDVLTYKTVRSRYRKCYELPNLSHIRTPQLTGNDDVVTEGAYSESWAISFGMPSKAAEEWTRDVERARCELSPKQLLSVSVVASPEEGWTLKQIVADFVECARLATDSGADAVEANLSCPNVCSQEGQLYTSPEASAEIAGALANVLHSVPLILKIGLFDNSTQASEFVTSIAPYANALSTTNSISAKVMGSSGQPAFGGLSRGIGGLCIRDRCNAEVRMLSDVVAAIAPHVRLIGVGGIASTEDARERLANGAHHIQIATAAMLNPLIGIRMRAEMAKLAPTTR